MIIARIQSLLPALRPSERRVAELVLAQPTLAAGASIKMIAAAAGASEPTVIRFCRAVGCAGVQDLKRQIARDLGRHTPPRLPEPGGDGLPLLAAQVIEHAFSALYDLRRLCAEPALAEVVMRVTRARALWFWGFGETARGLEAAAEAFTRDGWIAQAAADPSRQAAQARSLPQGALALAVSFSGPAAGETTALEPALRIHRAGGGQAVLFGPPGSALAALVDASLPLPGTDGDWPGAGGARLAALAVLFDVLRQGALLERERAASPPERAGA